MLTSTRTSTLQFARQAHAHTNPVIIPHKSSYPLSLQYKRFSSEGVCTNAYKSSYLQRIRDNTARLYARRVIELAALSAATMMATMSMDSKCESAMINKPKEWATIDLVEERKRFGESISSLGKTKISRVWAAGKFSSSDSCLDYIYIYFGLIEYLCSQNETKIQEVELPA